jgi:hypothetical protein
MPRGKASKKTTKRSAKRPVRRTTKKIVYTAEETEQLFRNAISRVETALRIHVVINAAIGLGFLYYLRTQESNPSMITRIDKMMYAIAGVTALILIISPLSALGTLLALLNTALWIYIMYESYYMSRETESPTAYHVYLAILIILIIKDLGVFVL